MEPPVPGSLDPKYDHIEMMSMRTFGGMIVDHDQVNWYKADDSNHAFRNGLLIRFLDFITLHGITIAEMHVETLNNYIVGFRINPQLRATFRQNLRVPNNLIPERGLLDEIAVSVTRLHVTHIQHVRNVHRINLYWADPSGCLIVLLTSTYVKGKKGIKGGRPISVTSPILDFKPIEMPTDVKPSSVED